ncbi:MAG: hypothetical protein N2050_08170 [Flavobacteriales bacterium]|nr:hypothetical protein [Flavobacteriales bacterium]
MYSRLFRKCKTPALRPPHRTFRAAGSCRWKTTGAHTLQQIFFFILGVPPGAFSRRPGVGLLRAPRRSGNPFGRSAASGQCRRVRRLPAPNAPASASLTHTPAPLSPSSFALYLPSLFGV